VSRSISTCTKGGRNEGNSADIIDLNKKNINFDFIRSHQIHRYLDFFKLETQHRSFLKGKNTTEVFLDQTKSRIFIVYKLHFQNLGNSADIVYGKDKPRK